MSSERLDAVIADYLQAQASGQPADPEAWLARHPELADGLRAFFADHARMEQVVAPLRPGAAEPATIPPTGDYHPAEPATLLPGQTAPPTEPVKVRYFGDYELLEEIARGGMGVVYKARQVSLNRIVALKMILAGHLAGKEEIDRFRIEAEAAANLDHPHIVPIYEIGDHQGQHYFSMKYVEGSNLASQFSLAPQARRSVRDLASLLIPVCRAVHHAHQRGILHRDLKPGNILLAISDQPSAVSQTKGTSGLNAESCTLTAIPMVTDFGLAKKVQGDSGMTQTGAIVGTPSYIAPEQAAAKKGLTTAVDVYSLGAILYEMLTGRPPFREATPLETLMQVMDKEPIPPRQLIPDVDPDLETICLKCLEKDPEKRYGSALALAEELERWQKGEPIQARPLSPWEYGWKWVRRNPLAVQVGSVCLLLTVSAFAAVLGANRVVIAGLLGISWFGLLFFPLLRLSRRRDEEEWRAACERWQRGEIPFSDWQEPMTWREAMNKHLLKPGKYILLLSVLLLWLPFALLLDPFDWLRSETRTVWSFLSFLLIVAAACITVARVASWSDRHFDGAFKRLAAQEINPENLKQRMLFFSDVQFLFAHAFIGCCLFLPVWKHLFLGHFIFKASATLWLGVILPVIAAIILTGMLIGVAILAFRLPAGIYGYFAAFFSLLVLSDAYFKWMIMMGGGRILPWAMWYAGLGSFLVLLTVVAVCRKHVRHPPGNADGILKLWLIAMIPSLCYLGGSIGLLLGGRFGLMTGPYFGLWAGVMAALILGHQYGWPSLTGRTERRKLSLRRVAVVFAVPLVITNAALWWPWLTAGPTIVALDSSERASPAPRLFNYRDKNAILLRGKAETVFGPHPSDVGLARLSPDGQVVLTTCKDPGSGDELLIFWDAHTATERRRLILTGSLGVAFDASLSPDRRQVATAHTDWAVRIWDVETGREVHCLEGHWDSVDRVAWTLDGQQLLSGGEDSTIRVWDAATGKCVGVFREHRCKIKAIQCLAPDGLVQSVDLFGTVKRWRLP